MKAMKYLSIVLAGLLFFIACSKEYSIESGYAGMVASGTLLDTARNCKNIVTKGSYITDSTLTDSNYVTVQVNFTAGGTYKIFSDTQNGFSFQDSGVSAPGLHSIKLKGTGRPVLAKPTTFSVAFDTSFCTFTVNVIGNTPATYTLVGSSGACSNYTVNGTYRTNNALTTSNTVTLQVAVTSPGSYSVQTSTINGITFSGTGNLSGTGLQVITLQGSGTPTAVGTTTFPVTAGGSSCSFNVTVVAGSAGNNPNVSDTAWQFSQGTNSFHGPMYDAFDTTVSGAYALVLLGYSTATPDTTMQLTVYFSGGTIQPGTYSSTSFAAFYYTNYADTANPIKVYTADPTARAATTNITISSYNASTGIVTGTFSGTALNNANVPVPVTNGRFTAKVR